VADYNDWRDRIFMEQVEQARPEPDKRMTILDEAAYVTDGDRQDWYGSPTENHGCTAALWNAYIARRRQGGNHDLDAFDVAMCNILQKVSRLAHDRRRDGLVDTAGYARNAEVILDDMARLWAT